jgi:hypothetical protein
MNARRVRSRSPGRETGNRSVAIFHELREMLAPLGLWESDIVVSLFSRQVTDLKLRSVESDHTVSSSGRVPAANPVAAQQHLRAVLAPLLIEVSAPFGETTIPVREGTVKELVFLSRVREGEPLPLWTPPENGTPTTHR